MSPWTKYSIRQSIDPCAQSIVALEPTIGFEPMTSSLPRRYSTPELRGRRSSNRMVAVPLGCRQRRYWSGKRDSNPQPSAWKADALPLSYSRFLITLRAAKRGSIAPGCGGGGRIRTSEGSAGRFTVCSLWPLGNPSTVSPKDKSKKADNDPVSRFLALVFSISWSWRWDLNPQPPDYKSGALPIELRQHEPEKYTRQNLKINMFFARPFNKKPGSCLPGFVVDHVPAQVIRSADS